MPKALPVPHMPFSIHPRIGRTKSSSSREKKRWSGEEGTGGGNQSGVPWVSPNNGVGSTLCISGSRHLPGHPHPSPGSRGSNRNGWQGQLLVPLETFDAWGPPLTTIHTGRNGKRRRQMGGKKTSKGKRKESQGPAAGRSRAGFGSSRSRRMAGGC